MEQKAGWPPSSESLHTHFQAKLRTLLFSLQESAMSGEAPTVSVYWGPANRATCIRNKQASQGPIKHGILHLTIFECKGTYFSHSTWQFLIHSSC